MVLSNEIHVVCQMEIHSCPTLCEAARDGHHECVQMLIAAGADPNVTDPYEMVPLHWAARDGHHECIQMLIAAGADPNVADPHGFTPLYWAVFAGHHECVRMLIAAGADPNVADTGGFTPLYWAAIKDHKECVQMLSAAGADPYVVDTRGFTPLYWAAIKDHKECVRMLIVRTLSERALRDDEWALVPPSTTGLGSMLRVVLARDGRDAAAKLVSLLPAADREVLETVAMSLGCKLPRDVIDLILTQSVCNI
ncbi:ankyrin repeat PH and SEC7 domain containing protein [Paramecium bursaria Chlorella virus NE-JV-1]|nr:ankyrin repeat PH and SEC7 domain containing protein [Paramecium bursaria Chlorella virus NE-JV-1]